MKRDPEAVSPFAALNPQEQKEQWIWWQCQHGATYAPFDEVQIDHEDAEAVVKNDAKPTEVQSWSGCEDAKPTVSRYQYNAVVARMQRAKRLAGAYTSTSG